MEESGSEGLDDLINSEVKKGKDGWFHGVDCVCIVRLSILCAKQNHRIGIEYLLLVGQLLAQYTNTLLDLRFTWIVVLQNIHLWTC